MIPLSKRGRPQSQLESEILAEIMLALSLTPDVRVFRNNVGLAKTERGTALRYGLGVGSADLIGSILVRVDKWTIGRAVALEVKRPDWRVTAEQSAWLKTQRERGWVAEVVHSRHEAMQVVELARRWEI